MFIENNIKAPSWENGRKFLSAYTNPIEWRADWIFRGDQQDFNLFRINWVLDHLRSSTRISPPYNTRLTTLHFRFPLTRRKVTYTELRIVRIKMKIQIVTSYNLSTWWPQHRELHALLFTNSVWVLLRPTGLWTVKGCETGPTVYSPYPRRPESLTFCEWFYKGSTFSSAHFQTLRVGPTGVELTTSRMATRCPNN